MDNPFALFGLPEQFALDQEALTQTYRTLSARFHPDRFAASNAFEQRQALMMAAAVNRAYQTLSQPADRAAALLRLQGIDADAPEHTAFAPEFLMQQMQWREDLADAQSANDQNAVQRLADECRSAQNEIYAQIAQSLSDGDYTQAAQQVCQARFLDRFSRETAASLAA